MNYSARSLALTTFAAAVRLLQSSHSSSLPAKGFASMCYYDNFKYACHDWKWGNFRQHCHKECRTGETCGMKIIYQTIMLAEKCPSCEKIDKKLRRRAKALSDHARWAKEGSKFKASMEKALEEVVQLDHEIHALQVEKERRYAAVGNPRRN